jgi:hypothetical protein
MKRQQRIGKHGQITAASVLAGRCQINMVEQIGTPVILVPVVSARRNTYQVIWGEKVSGDHRGLIGNGISVLAETKTILDRNLRYSDLREHQPGRLSDHANYGGISLLVWVHGTGAYVMRWPIDGFEAGTSITHEQAQALDRETVAFLDRILMNHEREIEQLARDLDEVLTHKPTNYQESAS